MMKKISAYIKLIRPRQWIKNFFVVAPLLFSFKLFDMHAVTQISFAFVIFCFTASAIYIFNDLRDIEADRRHPKNCHRPLAAKTVSIKAAVLLLLAFIFAVFAISFIALQGEWLTPKFFFILLLYLCINVGYSLGFKHIPLVEMFLVGSGYILRVIAGSIAISVTPSPWILVCTGIVSLLIVAGKRRAELTELTEGHKSRKSIDGYNIAFLDSLISLFGASTIITYMLFTLSEYATNKFHTQNLIITSIFVVFGVTRYIQLIKVSKGAGSPTDLVISDIGIRFSVIFWVISLFLIIYIF